MGLCRPEESRLRIWGLGVQVPPGAPAINDLRVSLVREKAHVEAV